MNRTKIRNFALLFTLILFTVSLAFSIVTVFGAKADETLADVGVEIGTHEDLEKTTDNNIYGKENVTAVGWNGWGGIPKRGSRRRLYPPCSRCLSSPPPCRTGSQ